MFCPDCGIDHHAAEREAAAEAKAEADRAIEIARLETHRDIEVAKITAKAGAAIAETEAEADLAHAEGQVEGMETVIDAATGDGGDGAEAEPGAEPETVIVESGDGEPAAELEPVGGPPEHEPSNSEPAGGGWWKGYR